MAMDLNEVKINVRSLLTSSQKPLSISQLQRDYLEQEGCNLPYRSLGFSSVIELLKNMTDVVTVPPNANESSMLSLVVGDKTNHLRMLVVKQKTNTRKKKGKSNMNNRIVHQNHNRNNNFSGRNSYNQRMPTKTNNYSNNNYQNIRSDYRRSNNSSISSNQLNQSYSSSSKSHSDMNRNGTSHEANSSYGYVTDNLRSNIERYIIENQMPITLNKLKQIVQKHPDYSVMDVHSMHDLKDRVKGFLNINDEDVSLKNSLYFKSNIQRVHHDTDAHIKPSEPDSLPNIPSYECNAQNVVSELYARLTIDELKEVTPHSKNKHDSNNGMNSKRNVSIELSTEYIEMCKNQSLMRPFQSGFNNTDKNSDIAKANLIKNIEYVKKQSEIRKNKSVESSLVNEKKSQSCSISMNGDNSLNNSNSFLHSTPKKNNNDSITLNGKKGRIPELMKLNIERIFKVYCKGVNIENFKFIYTQLYNPVGFDFSLIKQMLEVLDQIIEVRNNILYTKDYLKLCEKKDLEIDNNCLFKNICLNDETITTIIEQPILYFNQDKKKMLLAYTYNPSLFYLQLEPMELLDCLMIQMKSTYETKSNNYFVEPNQILPGLFYATSYSSFSNLKEWYRIKVLKVNSTTVEVIHVDYGIVDNIPKTELRFLNYTFCSLPCQAIHCCLTGYNELDSIAPEVTKAFLEIININKQVLVMVDDHFIFSKQYQILHVTLFQYKPNDSLQNINYDLTACHLNT
ncbi:ras guanine nucleotide exchange factor P [Acyrthosiphon pisum]|uniref:HTH OST-type domain-containing protein n=1 Tax=Acyrthosiphon pisum TaxID=7029 RepID=A0A8R2JTY3_ACYPI|nr:ras guanine nucleotide exchange factor P [Acyrthosiphon pisum]XP_029346810.1 ras guanine nucleotide exchange factor P [Acyrthosiphon pisum]XP_029346811.1 ras guanine nucleotide exchange factor P [Acyrthosiphon pisum]|eukprot:XP_003243244.1 PREDICTED: ras guanine nucleotide exchange factor P [Acyrthosiphon pisum]